MPQLSPSPFLSFFIFVFTILFFYTIGGQYGKMVNFESKLTNKLMNKKLKMF